MMRTSLPPAKSISKLSMNTIGYQHSQVPHLRQNTINMRVNYGLGKGLELDLDSPLLAIANRRR